MCGRFVLKTLDSVFEEFEVPPGELLDFRGSYNIAPTQSVAVVRAGKDDAHRREVALMHWGLIPAWAKDPAIGNRMINARAETLVEKPAFRNALQRRRCLIPADGFYEWKREGKGKRPFYIHRKDGRLLAFAGLWERWKDDAGHAVESCTVVTTRPNELMRGIHDRMPAILEPGMYDRWLTSGEPAEEIRGMLGPIGEGELEAHEVGKKVNRPGNDDPDCIAPVGVAGNDGGEEQGSLFG